MIADTPARFPGGWTWPRVAVTVWVVGGLGLAVHAYLKPTQHTLFPIYATGIRAWWSGAEDLYERQPETGEYYRYSPAFAVLAGPFGALPSGTGNAAWKLLNGAVLALGLWAWVRFAAPATSANFTAGVFLVTFVAVIGNLANGQANLMTAGFVLLGLTAAARDRWWWAAGFLAAATLIKAFPVALALVLSVLFWRKFPLRYVVALGAGLALPLAAQSPEYVIEQTGEWFQHLVKSTDLNRERLRSLERVFRHIGLGIEGPAFRALAAGAGAVVLAVAVWSARRGTERSELLFRVGAWFSAWVVLFTPSSENATFSILGPFVAWALVDALQRPGAWMRCVWLGASIYLMALSTGSGGGPLSHFFTTYHAPTAGAVLFQVWLCADLCRSRAQSIARPVSAPPDNAPTTALRRAV